MPRTAAVIAVTATLALMLVPPVAAEAQQVLTTRVISLEGARDIAMAAEAEAVSNGWAVAIAIVDPSGGLVFFQRRDGTQAGSLDVAVGKARTAARFRRPTKAFEDGVLGGRVNLLMLGDVVPIEGGLPILVEGELIGAIGVSGVTSQQDAQIAEAGLRALRTGGQPRP